MNNTNQPRRGTRRNALATSTMALSLANDDRQIRLLQSIAANTTLEKRGVIETVPDVPRIRLKKNKVYTFTKSFVYGTLVPTATLDSFAALAFSLDQCTGYTDIVNLFDQYRLVQAIVKIVPNQASFDHPIYTAIDYDDAAQPASVAAMLQYDTLRIQDAKTVIERVVNPCAPTEVYNSSLQTGYAPKWGVWIDSAYPGVTHFGLKVLTPAIPGTTTSLFNNSSINIELVIQGRSPI